MNGEKGQALPLAMLALTIGMLVITPFLGHASSNLIGSRTYEQSLTEVYSCDAGIEWALWRLKNDPVLTTDTTYGSAPLEPIPSEINSSSFPTTELRFVEDAGATETITPEWQDEKGKHDYNIDTTDTGNITVEIDNITASKKVKVQLKGEPGQPKYNFQGDGPYIAVFEDLPISSYIVEVDLPKETEYGPLGPGPITISITYPIASYDIRAQKGDRIITARATASYLATTVVSWQVE